MARLAFFGTPTFALPFLKRLHHYCKAYGHDLVLVVSQIDQPQGRGQKFAPTPVKACAEILNVPIAQPTTLKKNTPDGDELYERIKNADLDLAIVVAYGKIITERLLALPRRGFLNVHGSLLPRFRGAAPIQRAILAGDKETGVCLMDMVKGLDEGDVYACKATPILASDTSATLFRRLSYLGSSLLIKHLDKILEGNLVKCPQAKDGLVYAHMLDKKEGLLDFSKSGQDLAYEVRGFDPWPTSFGFIRHKRVKFFDSFFIHAPDVHKDAEAGTIVAINEWLVVKTIDGLLYLSRMQVEGKNVMPVKLAVRGFAVEAGDKIAQQ